MKWSLRALLAAALCLTLWSGGDTVADDAQDRAGLVIDYGDGTVTYAIVPFDESSISGIELLERSGVSLVTVEFGGLGEAVCTIGDRGCGVGDCRQRVCQSSDPDSPFWQYFRLTDNQTWTPLLLGASSAKVEDGTIDGWSWTGTEPELPVVDLAEIESIVGPQSTDGELSEPSVRTIDASGQVLEEKSRRSSRWSYLAAGVVITVLAGAAGLLALHRKRGRVAQR